MTDNQADLFIPPCRVDATPESLQREADRAVLYGACLLVVRPGTRIKPQIKAAVEALTPAVRAYYQGDDPALAKQALSYAEACGGRDFLEQKAAVYRERLDATSA
ncbi:MAG: hypothetical protein JOZ51_10225 [Chloroflexi bacterium]|nr:hypothetical protein [Chloroflexota bacterium]